MKISLLLRMIVLSAIALLAWLPAAWAEHDGKVQVLLLGDSTTIGSVCRKEQPNEPQLEDVIRELLAAEQDLPPVDVINQGRDGEYIHGLLTGPRYAKDVAGLKGIDYIFIRYGLNDINKRTDFDKNFPDDYRRLIAQLRKDFPQATLIPMTIIPYMDAERDARINSRIKAVADAEKLAMFDVYTRYLQELASGPNMLNYRRFPLEQIPERQRAWLKPYIRGPAVFVMDNRLDAHFKMLPNWFGDRHPNLAGYHVIGDETAKYLARLLRAKHTSRPAQSGSAAPRAIEVEDLGDHLRIETDKLEVRINTRGYVSGVARQGLLDKQTGARDLGFGLHVMDFLLAPGNRDDGYAAAKHHGRIAKHYVEGPQICTQAKQLFPKITRGHDFVAVELDYTFSQPGKGYEAGSQWHQTMVFQNGIRYFLSSEAITSANTVGELFYRIDMPGHVAHKTETFSQVWLSYGGLIPASAFASDFAPDDRFLYQRREGHIPQRMIRAYQVKLADQAGPWLAGMTLDPAAVSEAWCHERGYICFIEELHRRAVRKGESFGAAYVVGWFDDIPQMEAAYDRYKGASRLLVENGRFRLK